MSCPAIKLTTAVHMPQPFGAALVVVFSLLERATRTQDVRRRRPPRRHSCGRRCPRIDTLRQGASTQSSAYIGIAAILAMFILAFATAPKTRAQGNGHWVVTPMTASYDEILLSRPLLPRRS